MNPYRSTSSRCTRASCCCRPWRPPPWSTARWDDTVFDNSCDSANVNKVASCSNAPSALCLLPRCAAPKLQAWSAALSWTPADPSHLCMLQAEQENAVQQGLKAVENGLEV